MTMTIQEIATQIAAVDWRFSEEAPAHLVTQYQIQTDEIPFSCGWDCCGMEYIEVTFQACGSSHTIVWHTTNTWFL